MIIFFYDVEIRHRFLWMFCRFNIAYKRYAHAACIPQSHRNSIRSARRADAGIRGITGAVIIRAAIVVVINQSLTLPDSRIAIYAEYLACAV